MFHQTWQSSTPSVLVWIHQHSNCTTYTVSLPYLLLRDLPVNAPLLTNIDSKRNAIYLSPSFGTMLGVTIGVWIMIFGNWVLQSTNGQRPQLTNHQRLLPFVYQNVCTLFYFALRISVSVADPSSKLPDNFACMFSSHKRQLQNEWLWRSQHRLLKHLRNIRVGIGRSNGVLTTKYQ